MSRASDNTTFALDGGWLSVQVPAMQTAQEILTALRERKVTQAAIASVLGIQQPNVSTLFNPVKRTGKPRELTYDEGQLLIRSFELTGAAHAPPPILPSADDFRQILDAVMPLWSEAQGKEAWLQEIALQVRETLERRMQRPDLSMDRILGSLDERLAQFVAPD